MLLTDIDPSDTIPLPSVWLCTAKYLQTAFITGDESDFHFSQFQFLTPLFIPLLWIGQFTSAEQLIKNFTPEKFLCHKRMCIEISGSGPWNIFENFGVLSQAEWWLLRQELWNISDYLEKSTDTTSYQNRSKAESDTTLIVKLCISKE